MNDDVLYIFLFGGMILLYGLFTYDEAKNNPEKLLKRYYTVLARELLGKEFTRDIYMLIGIINMIIGILSSILAVYIWIFE